MKIRRLSAYVGGLIVLVCLVVAGWLLLNREYVIDQLVVWQYEPSSDVVGLAERSKLSDKGTFYLYASRAEVDDAVEFNDECKKQEEHSAILGCYANRRIYIYNISDARLNGVKEVTAAHEMLHAAWDRLSRSEQEQLSNLLEAEYKKHQTPELAERMDYYARAQPGERANELHSIIGTEFNGLSSELEAHYQMYFTDRTVITGFHASYQNVFTSLEARTQAITAELSNLKVQVDGNSNSYSTQLTSLNADIGAFNKRAQSRDFTSQAEINQIRGNLESRIGELDALRASIASDIERYNQLVSEFNDVAIQSRQLTESIDSTLAAPPSL